jgi:hypothetical protein
MEAVENKAHLAAVHLFDNLICLRERVNGTIGISAKLKRDFYAIRFA